MHNPILQLKPSGPTVSYQNGSRRSELAFRDVANAVLFALALKQADKDYNDTKN